LGEKLFKFIYILYSIIRLFLNVSKYKYLFLLSCRSVDDAGRLFDSASDDVIKSCGSNHMLLDSKYEYYSKYSYDCCYSSPTFLFSHFTIKKYNFQFEELVKLIKSEFDLTDDLISTDLLNNVLSRYYFEKKFYKYLLKKHNIKHVFFIKNGSQKGLCAVAREMKVKITEIQHGAILFEHMNYNYPENIKTNQNIIVPDNMFVYSSEWFEHINFPSVEIVPVGNNHIAIDSKASSYNNSILVVSSNIHGEILKNFITEIIETNKFSDVNFIFKLHSNQSLEKDGYYKYFNRFENVSVVFNEKSIKNLFLECETVLVIESTIIFEALQANKRILLLKSNRSCLYNNLFVNPNISLINSIRDFGLFYKNPIKISENSIYFLPFNRNLALKYIHKIQ